jgi:predicted CXXCH cytochrome family protein
LEAPEAMKIRGARVRAWVPPALAGVLCLAAVLVASAEPRRGDPHAHFRNPDQCPKCHLSRGSQPGPGRFSTEADAACLECHTKGGMGRSHPVNVRPGETYPKREMKVPADLRLDDGGRIMCLTCHTAHGPDVYYFLRRSGPDRGFDLLCEACHGKR